MTVGVVDDDSSLRRSVRNLLTSVGLDVMTFASAEEFLRSGDLASLRSLVLDLKLEGMSGLELLARLRAMGSPIRVVMLTAHGDEEAKRQAVGLGAVAFLTKPFRPDALVDAVRGAIATDSSSGKLS